MAMELAYIEQQSIHSTTQITSLAYCDFFQILVCHSKTLLAVLVPAIVKKSASADCLIVALDMLIAASPQNNIPPIRPAIVQVPPHDIYKKTVHLAYASFAAFDIVSAAWAPASYAFCPVFLAESVTVCTNKDL